MQQLLLQGAWSDKVLALPGCGCALSSGMEVVWVGPRARMGISEAIPSRVVPHTTSGRADYFGPLVNRYISACIPPVQPWLLKTAWVGLCTRILLLPLHVLTNELAPVQCSTVHNTES